MDQQIHIYQMKLKDAPIKNTVSDLPHFTKHILIE